MRTGEKKPWLAAVLALFLGPIGLLYIGWRYAVTFFVAITVFVFFAVSGMGFGIAWWVKYLVLLLLAYKAWLLAKARNEVTLESAVLLPVIKSFPMATKASTDFFINIVMLYVGVSVAAIGIDYLTSEELVRGLSILLLGVPVLMILIRFFVGLLTGPIDALAQSILERRYGDVWQQTN